MFLLCGVHVFFIFIAQYIVKVSRRELANGGFSFITSSKSQNLTSPMKFNYPLNALKVQVHVRHHISLSITCQCKYIRVDHARDNLTKNLLKSQICHVQQR